MAREKVKDVDHAFRDSHSKGIVFTDSNKYEQAKQKRFNRRKLSNKMTQQAAAHGKMQKQMNELQALVNKLIEESKK